MRKAKPLLKCNHLALGMQLRVSSPDRIAEAVGNNGANRQAQEEMIAIGTTAAEPRPRKVRPAALANA
jgi:hypothetical protein